MDLLRQFRGKLLVIPRHCLLQHSTLVDESLTVLDHGFSIDPVLFRYQKAKRCSTKEKNTHQERVGGTMPVKNSEKLHEILHAEWVGQVDFAFSFFCFLSCCGNDIELGQPLE